MERNRRSKIIAAALFISFALALSSCGGDSLEATVEQMRDAACRGDVEGFMFHVDTEAVIRADRRKDLALDEDDEKAPWPDGILGEIISYAFLEMYLYDVILLPDKDDTKATKELLERIKRLTRNRLESEISKGRDSAFCRFEIQWSNSLSGVVKIDIEGRRGKDTLAFKNYLGDWKLEDLVSVSISDMPIDTHAGESTAVEGSEPADGLPPEEKDSSAKELQPSPPPYASRTSKESVDAEHGSDTIYKPGYDFRKTRWGMTPAQVEASENQHPEIKGGDESSGSYLVSYQGSSNGLDAMYLYSFTDGRLTKGAYYFETRHSAPNAYLDDYEMLKTKLTAKYGKPAFEKIVLGDDYFEGRPEDALGALVSGEATYAAVWFTQSTEITLHLYNDEGQLRLAMLYTKRDSQQP